jgi:hypothetical protein
MANRIGHQVDSVGVDCVGMSMLKRGLRVVWILVASVLMATAIIVLVEMSGVNLLRLAE